LNGCQWLTSHPAQFNPGKKPLYSRASLVIVEKRKIFVPTSFRTLDHPYVEKILYTPRYPDSQNIISEQVMTGGQTLPFYSLEGNPATVVQEAGGAPGPEGM
jgi:putative alpha-1,2-mannosidase